MKTLILKLSDDEYKRLEDEARKEGYVLLSDYVKHVLFSPSSADLPNSQKIERHIQDMINPFTQQIDEVKRKVADIIERVDQMEDLLKSQDKEKVVEKPAEKDEQDGNQAGFSQQQVKKKTVIDFLQERKVLYESEMKVRDPDAVFSKIRSADLAVIISTTKGRIAIEKNFLQLFTKKIAEIRAKDVDEASSKLSDNERKLFKTLVSVGLIYYDNEKSSWIMVTAKT
ncbi:hypothetical protein [Sulfuracidifex tepidarius]|uniref:CopG family transcriptional regulator n=1 Tax=Sulfuracidifex tepidarius TaxID=1294262 RepID=A0A510E4E5_9CREN|nr:hypothetical protein [Sulfuracidifex tepidarius]BBG24539.1 hypothetical protein IC006_1864 [Sulfuracidifex tepidarius]BBG27327.1 hypothetical protein IC007_1872 [Sulfuracidifex tepidarius]